MRIFGFDIIRVKKADYNEAKSLEKTVMILADTIRSYMDLVTNLDIRDGDEVVKLYYHLNTIDALVTNYYENKFATPFITINILSVMNDLKRLTSKLQTMIYRNASIIESIQMKREQVEFEEILEDPEIEEGLRGMDQSIRNMQILLTKKCVKLLTAVQFDVIRITSGVDIVRSSRHLKKDSPHGDVEFAVKIITNRPTSKYDKEE